MSSKGHYAIIVFAALALAGCRQADGPMPAVNPEIENELHDISRDLLNVADGRDPAAPDDLTHDLGKYPRQKDELPAVNELSRRTVSVISGRKFDEPAAQRMAHSLWTSVAARQLSERQVEALQAEMQSILTSIGVAEPQAQQVAQQVGEVQKAVSERPRRWYELF
jgi:hypothetical protein